MKARAVLALLWMLLPGACDPATGPETAAADGALAVYSVPKQLILRNHSARHVHYVAMEEETSTRVDLYFDPARWPSVAPGSRLHLPHAELMGYRPGAERAVVFWWTPGGSGTIRVRLR